MPNLEPLGSFVDWFDRCITGDEKSAPKNLQKHYRQAFDYWTRLVPNRPRYVVLCNIDEFWIYDFDNDRNPSPARIHQCTDIDNVAKLFLKAGRDAIHQFQSDFSFTLLDAKALLLAGSVTRDFRHCPNRREE